MCILHSSSETIELLQWLRHHDSIINIVRSICLLTYFLHKLSTTVTLKNYVGQADCTDCRSAQARPRLHSEFKISGTKVRQTL